MFGVQGSVVRDRQLAGPWTQRAHEKRTVAYTRAYHTGQPLEDMILIKRSLALVSLLALASVAALAQDSASLVWKPKAGNTLKYKLQVKASMEGQEFAFGTTITQKVLEVRQNGEVVVEGKQSNFTLSIAGEDMSAMMGDMAMTETSTMDRFGNVLSRKSDAPAEMDNARLDQAILFVFPQKADLKVGETWTRSVKADASKGQRAAEATFKFEGTETVNGIKSNKVTYTFVETEGTAAMKVDAVIYLASEDGELVKAEYKMKNLELGPGAPPSDATATIVRQ